MSWISATDPLALVEISAGKVTTPSSETGADGGGRLDTPQRAVEFGEPVPIVFGRRRNGQGGILISPGATEARFENDTDNDVTAFYHLVLSEGEIDSIPVKDVFQRSCRVGSHTQTYNRRAGTWTPGNYIVARTGFDKPECPYYCGSIGLYPEISTLSFQVTIPNGFDQWNRQVHCFIRGGMHVTRLRDDVEGPSDSFADLVYWMQANSGRVPAALIDVPALTAADRFLDRNGLTCNCWLTDSRNYGDLLADWASYFLLGESNNGGKKGLRPLLPVTTTGDIDTGAISWVFTFDEDTVIPGSLEIQYSSLADRLPFVAQVTWRQQLENDIGIIRTAEVRYTGTAASGPYESHDLSAFCTNENHAVKVGAYILAKRAYTSHTIRFIARPQAHNTLVNPGDIIRVKLSRTASGYSPSDHDFLYQVERITKTLAGDVSYECTHFPIDDQGRSLFALDVTAAQGSGILLTSNRTGVSCDINSAFDNTIPTEEFTIPGGEFDVGWEFGDDEFTFEIGNIDPDFGFEVGGVDPDFGFEVGGVDPDFGFEVGGVDLDGSITDLTLTDAGTDLEDGIYTGIELDGGTGSGLIIDIEIVNGVVVDWTIVDPGSGYELEDLLDAPTGSITDLTLTDAGTDLEDGIYTGIELDGGTGSGLIIDIEIVNGVVVDWTIVDPGSGYELEDLLDAPTGSITDLDILNPGGDLVDGTYTDIPLTGGAIVDFVVVNGIVTSVTIDTAGSGYQVGAVLRPAPDETGTSLASSSGGQLELPSTSIGAGFGGLGTIEGTPDDEDDPEAADDLDAERTSAGVYFHEVSWDGADLTVKVRISPTGVAPSDALGALFVTINSTSVVAILPNGKRANPQPSSLPSVSATFKVADPWEDDPDFATKPVPPADRIFQGQFVIPYPSSAFPPVAENPAEQLTYRATVEFSAFTGGFDDVTYLNTAVVDFVTTEAAGSNELVIYYDTTSALVTNEEASVLKIVRPETSSLFYKGDDYATTSYLEENAMTLSTQDAGFTYWRILLNNLSPGTEDFTIETYLRANSDSIESGEESLAELSIAWNPGVVYGPADTKYGNGEYAFSSDGDNAYWLGAVLGVFDSSGYLASYQITRADSNAFYEEQDLSSGLLGFKHVCIQRIGSNVYWHINGSLAASASLSGDMLNGTSDTAIFIDVGSNLVAGAAMGQVRYTKGQGRYGAGSFTPPTEAFYRTCTYYESSTIWVVLQDGVNTEGVTDEIQIGPVSGNPGFNVCTDEIKLSNGTVVYSRPEYMTGDWIISTTEP